MQSTSNMMGSPVAQQVVLCSQLNAVKGGQPRGESWLSLHVSLWLPSLSHPFFSFESRSPEICLSPFPPRFGMSRCPPARNYLSTHFDLFRFSFFFSPLSLSLQMQLTKAHQYNRPPSSSAGNNKIKHYLEIELFLADLQGLQMRNVQNYE